MLEPSDDALAIICVNLRHLCAQALYGLLRLTRLSAAVGPASPEGAKDYRRGYHPRVSDAQYKEALKGRKIFRAFSTPFIGSNINGD